MKVSYPDYNFWQDKKVLITGHSGFKGGWLSLWLKRMNAHIAGISLAPSSHPNLFNLAGIESVCESYFCDIRDTTRLANLINRIQPEIVFHLAAQALVRSSYQEPINTFSTNIMGTANILEALRNKTNIRVAIMITTDKVYVNNESYWPYRETDPLGGHDPYSASKAASEMIIDSYRKAFLSDQGVAVASCRAGNVIGGGDWSIDRLIPDAIRAWQNGSVLEIRCPEAIRPWQHVLEPLAGYLCLAQQLWKESELSGAYNFGPLPQQASTVRRVIEIANKAYGQCEITYKESSQNLYEAHWLTLEITKARQCLGFQPRFSLEEAIQTTMAWYYAQHKGVNARTLCEQDIATYEDLE